MPPPIPPPHQIDDHPATLDMGATRQGYAFGTKIEPTSTAGIQWNHEYWVTLGYYVPARGSAPILLRWDSSGNHDRVAQFLGSTRAMSGASLTVASCVYAAAIPMDP